MMYTGLAANLVQKLQSAGFSARQLGGGVIVSLNRPLSTTEVLEIVGDHYKLTKVSRNQVMVEE